LLDVAACVLRAEPRAEGVFAEPAWWLFPPPLARGAVRVSLGPTTTESHLDRFNQAWIRVSGALLKRSEGIAA